VGRAGGCGGGLAVRGVRGDAHRALPVRGVGGLAVAWGTVGRCIRLREGYSELSEYSKPLARVGLEAYEGFERGFGLLGASKTPDRPEALRGCPGAPIRGGLEAAGRRHVALQLVEPVEDDVDVAHYCPASRNLAFSSSAKSGITTICSGSGLIVVVQDGHEALTAGGDIVCEDGLLALEGELRRRSAKGWLRVYLRSHHSRPAAHTRIAPGHTRDRVPGTNQPWRTPRKAPRGPPSGSGLKSETRLFHLHSAPGRAPGQRRLPGRPTRLLAATPGSRSDRGAPRDPRRLECARPHGSRRRRHVAATRQGGVRGLLCPRLSGRGPAHRHGQGPTATPVRPLSLP